MPNEPKKPSTFEFLASPNYKEERDGPLGKYLDERCYGNNATALFRGWQDFEMLKEKGLILPGITNIRIMWSWGRDDEYYTVTDDFKLQGVTEIAAHQGDEGIFDPKKKLKSKAGKNTQNWELHSPNMDVLMKLVKEEQNK